MLKVLATVLAVLSAAISITIYTATLPDVQKQVEDIKQEQQLTEFYFVYNITYTSGAPTFISTELHYFSPAKNKDELNEFLKSNIIHLSYYVANNEKFYIYNNNLMGGSVSNFTNISFLFCDSDNNIHFGNNIKAFNEIDFIFLI